MNHLFICSDCYNFTLRRPVYFAFSDRGCFFLTIAEDFSSHEPPIFAICDVDFMRQLNTQLS